MTTIAARFIKDRPATLAQRTASKALVWKRIVERGLDTTGDRVVITGSDKRTNTIGTDSAQVSSIKRYGSPIHSLQYYAWRTGDLDSQIILEREICPNNPGPVLVDTVIGCLRYNVMELGTPLLHHKTNQPILDVDGNEMFCQGNWTGMSSTTTFRNALSKLHSHYEGTTGQYTPQCTRCHQVPLEEALAGKTCCEHIGRSQYSRRGSPTTDFAFKNVLKQMQGYVKNVYESRQTWALLPFQLRDIIDFCIASNQKYYFMIGFIMVLGVKGFLRIEEDLDVAVERFVTEYFAVTEHNVEALAMWVDGKTEKEKAHLALWDDLECPYYAASRWTMIWMKISGIKGGKLFPCKEQLDSGCTNPTVALSYADMLQEIKNLMVGPLGIDPNSPKMRRLIVGTHTLKRTAHLFAFWGLKRKYEYNKTMFAADEANIQASARHAKGSRQTANYLGDAGTLLTLCQKLHKDDERHKVSEFQSIIIKTDVSYEALNLPGKEYQKPLVALADWYVQEKLGVSDAELAGMKISDLWRRTMEFVPVGADRTEVNYQDLLRKHLPPDVYETALSNIQQAQADRINQAVKRFAEINDAATNLTVPSATAASSVTTAVAVATLPSVSNKRSRPNPEDSISFGDKDWKQEAAKRNLSKAELLAICEGAMNEIRQQKLAGKQLVDPIKRWAHRVAVVLDCLSICHGGDRGAFLAANPSFTVSTFACSKKQSHKGCL
jgi:hypothetical protein